MLRSFILFNKDKCLEILKERIVKKKNNGICCSQFKIFFIDIDQFFMNEE